MNSERVGWKRRDIPRVKQRDNDVTKISGVVGGKSHYGSGDPQIPLKVVLEHRIFVGNISYKVTKADLMKFFSKYGDVVNVHIVKDHAKGWSKGYGFVTFSDADATKKALEAPEDELYLDHRALRISKAEESRKAGFGALMAVDRDHRQVQRQKNQHTVNCHKAENANHDNSSPEVKPKQSSKSPKTTRRKYSKKSSKCCLLSLLNNDVLMEIFSYLPVKDRIISERVCKHWRDTLQKLWLSTKHLSFDNSFSIFKSRQGLTDKVLESVVAKGSGELVSMDLSAVPHLLTEHALSVIGVYCPKVTTLDLSGVAVTMKSMQVLTDRCIQLKWLRLQKCHQVTEKCLWWILRKCAHLEHLDVAGNRSVTGQCFVIVPKTIRSVILSECRQLAAAGISKLAHHCPNLELLDITKCCNINDQAIQDVLQHCLKLKELHFPVQSTAVKSTGFAANSLKNLTILVINGHLMFNDEALVNITKNCPQLKELQCATCYNISDVGVASLTSCIQLSYLDISYCNNVTDKGLVQVIAICQLQHLITRACQGITDVGVCYLASHLASLVRLDLSGCMSITTKSLEALQESLLYGGQNKTHFNLLVGGTLIGVKPACQFAAATGASVCHHDMSIPSLAADYDPFLDMPPLTEESWEARHKQIINGDEAVQIAAGDEYYDYYLPDAETIVTEEALDLLTVEDPAMLSDDFSNPDDFFDEDEYDDFSEDDDDL